MIHGEFSVPFPSDGDSESTITEKLIGIKVSILPISHVDIIITHIASIVVAIQSDTPWHEIPSAVHI